MKALANAGCRALFVLAGTVVVTAIADRPAFAQSSQCRQLSAQLANLDSDPSRVSPAYRQWDQRVADQRRAMAATERQARAGRCGAGGRQGLGTPHPQCGQILSTLEKMRSNLRRLEQRRNRYAGNRGQADGAKRRIRQRMEAAGCNGPQRRQAADRTQERRVTGNRQTFTDPIGRERGGAPEPRSQANREGGLLARLFGRPDVERAPTTSRSRYYRGGTEGRRRYRRVLTPNEDFVDDYSNGAFRGTFRTMCVRQCDGYYFPISFSTTEQMFGRDADQCSRICPSGNAELFVHENPGGSPEDMTSLAGQSYSDTPNAFRYRRSFDKNCTCRSVTSRITTLSRLTVDPNVLTVQRREPIRVLGSDAPETPLPLLKRSIDLDPDTMMNRLGAAEPEIFQSNGSDEEPESRPIRIVGPRYFYAQ